MRVTELAFGIALQQVDVIVRSGSIDDRNRHVSEVRDRNRAVEIAQSLALATGGFIPPQG
jgi:hypothetical protein